MLFRQKPIQFYRKYSPFINILSNTYEKALPFLEIFSKNDKKTFILIISIQSFTAVLDLLGIFLVGIVGTLSANYLVGTSLNVWSSNFINFFKLTDYSVKFVIFIISFMILVFFVLKSIFSIYLNQKILIFYARKYAAFSSQLYYKLLNSNYAWLKTQNNETIHTALGSGAEAIFVRVVGNFIMVISDAISVIFLLIFLIVFSPIVSIFTFIYLLLIAIFLHKIIGKKALSYGSAKSKYTIKQHTYINIILYVFKEIFVMKKDNYYKDKFEIVQKFNSVAEANSLWIQQLPKYIFEIALTIGIFLLSFFLLSNNISNISTLLIFVIASGRLIPSLFRIQSGIIGVNLNYPKAMVSIEFWNVLQVRSDLISRTSDFLLTSPPSIKIQSVSFSFPDSKTNLLDGISLEISSGEILAFVGKSGSGKTTLVDLILNIYKPSDGRIVMKDGTRVITPGIATNISYVPQNPVIFNATLSENIAIGLDLKEIIQEDLDYAISSANLNELIARLPAGINTQLNNLGGILSGGEKQRIAIARALYTRPKLLVIDEGTSSLDYSSEKYITDSLMSLAGKTTVILIAHRITTIKSIRNIYFFSEGKIVGAGNYDSLQKLVPEFANWVDLMNSETNS